MSKPFIITASGLRFPLLSPQPEQVRLRDISRHLAKINRFNGATRECYSVAQHSLHVCEVLATRKAKPLLQMHGLLHDAHEAYSGDIVAPMKLALKAFGTPSSLDAIEGEISCAIFDAFGLDDLQRDEHSKLSIADQDMLATEVRDLMPESDWSPPGTPVAFVVKPLPWDVAEGKFLKKFDQLAAIIGLKPLASIWGSALS